MMFRTTIIASLAATVAAKSFVPKEDISMNSELGKKIMHNARELEQAQQQDGDISWMYNYKIKYLGCSSLIQVREEGGGEDESMVYTQNFVKFGLVKEGKPCVTAGNGDAQYVVNMADFVDAYTEMKMEAKERQCEYVRESCYCDNADDAEACEYQCYVDQGMNYCIQYEGEEEFEIQRYLECAELEAADNNNNNNNGNYNYNNYNYNNNNGVDMYSQYWVGPTCGSDGKTINLAVFKDAGCTTKAKKGVWEAFNYGTSLPFARKSIVYKNECISCEQEEEDQGDDANQNNNYNNNYQQNYEVNELCEQSYEMAAKCEKNFSPSKYFYPDTSGCKYINKILPQLEKAARNIKGSPFAGGPSFGAVFFFLTSCALGAYAFFLYRKIHRAKVNLSATEGMGALA